MCSICESVSSRKWNAQRHNFTHINQGEIYDKFNNLVPNLPLPYSINSSSKNYSGEVIFNAPNRLQKITTTITLTLQLNLNPP